MSCNPPSPKPHLSKSADTLPTNYLQLTTNFKKWQKSTHSVSENGLPSTGLMKKYVVQSLSVFDPRFLALAPGRSSVEAGQREAPSAEVCLGLGLSWTWRWGALSPGSTTNVPRMWHPCYQIFSVQGIRHAICMPAVLSP